MTTSGVKTESETLESSDNPGPVATPGSDEIERAEQSEEPEAIEVEAPAAPHQEQTLSEAGDRRMPRSRLRRRLFVLVPLLAVAFGVAGGLYSMLSSTTYTASTLVQIDAATVPGNQSLDAIDDQEIATQRLVMNSETVANQVLDALKLGVSVQRLQNSVDVQQVNDSRVLKVTATWDSPDGAATVANAFGEQYLAYRTTQRDQALAALGAGAEGLRPGPIGLILTPAVPDKTPAGPGPAVVTVLSALLGLIVGIVIALLLERRPRIAADAART